MGDYDKVATCLSSAEHGSDVRDVLLHYFGCLRANKRAEFFASLPPAKKQRIRLEETVIWQQRAHFEKEEDTRGLVERFKRSHNEFFYSLPREKQKLIREEEKRLSELRSILELGTDEVRNSPDRPNQPFSRQSTSSLEGGSNVAKPSMGNGFGFRASAVFFRNSEPYTDPSCSDHFPNQEKPLKDLLYNKDKAVNPLMRDCEKCEIRWFHFPANNMDWVEAGEPHVHYRC
jgi:hypothetical protein